VAQDLSPAQRTLTVGVLGAGTVGSQVIRLLTEQADDFAARYRQELQDPEHQAALAELWRLAGQQPHTVLLTAVKHPEHSHLAVLLDYLHESG